MKHFILACSFLFSSFAFADVADIFEANLGSNYGSLKNNGRLCKVSVYKPGEIENCGGYCIKITVSTRHSWLEYPSYGWSLDKNSLVFDYGEFHNELTYWQFEVSPDSHKLKSVFKMDKRGKTPLCILD